MTLRLLSRPGCHLCHEMRAILEPMLRTLGRPLLEVDIDTDPALAARWGSEIPVLLDETGRVVAKALDPPERILRRLG